MAEYEINNIPGDIDWESNGSPLARTLANCKNLLMCKKGEVPYDRLRGFDTALLDLPIAELNRRLMPEMDRILAWEPDAEAVRARATMNEDGGIVIRCVIETKVRG